MGQGRMKRPSTPAVQRRARLYGVSTDDPVLKHGPTSAFPDSAQGQEACRRRKDVFLSERWYAGCARIPPGSFPAACTRYGGEGAAAVAARTVDVATRTAGFDGVSHNALVDEWVPPMRAEPTGYVAGPSTPYTLRNWPAESRYPMGFACTSACALVCSVRLSPQDV